MNENKETLALLKGLQNNKYSNSSSTTSCISLIVPKMSIFDLRSFINQEKNTARNIKSGNNRKSVVDALTAISAYFSNIKLVPDNGFAVYAHSLI
jgi:peptide subunit release factor 1 (eRF1)